MAKESAGVGLREPTGTRNNTISSAADVHQPAAPGRVFERRRKSGAPVWFLSIGLLGVILTLFWPIIVEETNLVKLCPWIKPGGTSSGTVSPQSFLSFLTPQGKSGSADNDLPANVKRDDIGIWAKANDPSTSGMKLYTIAELSRFDGSSPSNPVYVAFAGYIFDVSSGRNFYAKSGGSYSMLGGKPITVAMAKMSMKPENLNDDTTTLTTAQVKELPNTLAFFESKYEKIGILVYE